MKWIVNNGHKKCIISIVIGEQFTADWNLYCKDTWIQYAQKYDYDLLIFDSPLDSSPRSSNRSPSWQKCLAINHPMLQTYEQVVWMDADVLINSRTAPDIGAAVPQHKIGGTNAYSVYNTAMHDHLYAEYLAFSEARKQKRFVSKDGCAYYRLYGIETDIQDVIQCGILVLNPNRHASIFQEVYDQYEEKVDPETGYAFNLEMRPLSYEITRRNLHHWIDFRFNAIVSNLLYLNAPYLFLQPKRYEEIHFQLALTSIYTHHWFLHFAGGAQYRNWMKYILPGIQKPNDFMSFSSSGL